MQTKLDIASDKALRETLHKPTRVNKAGYLRTARENGDGDWFGPWLKTTLGPGKLTADEFLYYRLNRSDLDDADRCRYVGKTVQTRLHFKCNKFEWRACADDKLLFHRLIAGSGYPLPELRAVHGPGSATDAWTHLGSEVALRSYLGEPGNYPLFVKPIDGIYSIGAMLLKRIDDEVIELGDARRVPVEELVAYMVGLDESGYLLQTVLEGAPELEPVFGSGLAAARLMVLLDESGPRVHIATLKLPLAEHDADNFWRTGNMLAPIDLDTGVLGIAITGYAQAFNTVDVHPDTEAPLAGVSLPRWDDAMRSVLDAASRFPGIRTQGWDVAFTRDGPVLLELNYGGDLNLHQLAHERGILDAGYCEHLRSCGYRGKLPE